MKSIRRGFVLLVLAAHAFPIAAEGEIRGNAKAVVRANGMLARIGGREPWAAVRTLYVKERVFLRDGEVTTVEIWRDFVALTRYVIAGSPISQRVLVLGESNGWAQRNGTVRLYPESEFTQEKQGFIQEPYYIYHRLARGDSALRVELEGTDRLNVYDENHRLLCWFVLDQKDHPISWGNHYDGSITQHWYGPSQRFGPINLPKWGSATDGSWRFEYVDASLTEDPLEVPAAPMLTHSSCSAWHHT